MARVSMIAAIGRNGELGKGNELLWKIPDDLKRFRALTRGHPVIMGRKTFESIGRVLPERANIVVTRDAAWQYEGVIAAASVEEAIEKAKTAPGAEEIFVIGGGQIYEAALPHADKLYLTLIEDQKDADSFFPAYKDSFTKKVFDEPREWEGFKYRWVDLEK